MGNLVDYNVMSLGMSLQLHMAQDTFAVQTNNWEASSSIWFWRFSNCRACKIILKWTGDEANTPTAFFSSYQAVSLSVSGLLLCKQARCKLEVTRPCYVIWGSQVLGLDIFAFYLFICKRNLTSGDWEVPAYWPNSSVAQWREETLPVCKWQQQMRWSPTCSSWAIVTVHTDVYIHHVWFKKLFPGCVIYFLGDW